MKTSANKIFRKKISASDTPIPTDEEISCELGEDDEIYIVNVDTRGKSPSDLECFKERSCNFDFFQDHIHDDPKMICVKSQIAGMCGLDLKLFFHEHHKHHEHDNQKTKSAGLLTPHGHTNGAATLLLFNPETNKVNYVVQSKAHIVLDDGRTPLSKRQVWGIVELIREARSSVYKKGAAEGVESNNHLDTFALKNAYLELTKLCAQYQHHAWAPHSIYEERHPHRAHHHQHDEQCNGESSRGIHNRFHRDGSMEDPKAQEKSKESKRAYARHESGISDAATCHHGVCHHHHEATIDHIDVVEVKPMEDRRLAPHETTNRHHYSK